MHIEIPQELVDAQREADRCRAEVQRLGAALEAAQIRAELANERATRADRAFRAEFCRLVQEMALPTSEEVG